MANSDRRSQRTRAQLRQALIELLQESGYEAISIRDITEKACVGYATFFRHYDGKESLLADAFEQSVGELNQLLHSLGETDAEVEGKVIFEHVQERQLLYQVLLRGEATLPLIAEVQRDAAKELVMRYARYTPSIPAGLLANYVVVSIVALIKWWLRNDMPFDPEHMGQFYAELIMKPVEQLLHHRPSPTADRQAEK